MRPLPKLWMVLEMKVIRNVQALGKSASVKSHALHHLQELTFTHACTHTLTRQKNNHKAGNHKWWSCKELKREVWWVMHLQFCEDVPLTLQTTWMEPLRKFRLRISIFAQEFKSFKNVLIIWKCLQSLYKSTKNNKIPNTRIQNFQQRHYFSHRWCETLETGYTSATDPIQKNTNMRKLCLH